MMFTVLFVSLHGDPTHAFPHFLGYSDETGQGDGENHTVNYPLPPGTPVEVDMEDVTTYVLSAEYTWQDLIVAAEYFNEDMDPEYFAFSSINFLSTPCNAIH